jgi:four helix bundle protein
MLNNQHFADHHKITAFLKSKELLQKIISLHSLLPTNKASEIVYYQIFRSASSIGANIAEGYGRNNQKEYKHFLGIARGSSFETEYWLEVIQESYNLDLSSVVELNKEIIKLLTVTIKSLSNKQND